ncbi:hypothetical protein NECAME_15590 [Necator americanus]|uniref:Uncharacterized protein n=1 Tax=Necator americanus TaxID=51031 RepID=W2SGZ9_NECAM|nr:hypothetical protein NECAME_15590 [Necator americanus]ETN68870.1 hypothetical protein NECAME_15590 [Necator americanus]
METYFSKKPRQLQITNSTAVPLINRIGLSTGILIWGSAKCLTGWVTGRFGVFGMKPNPPASDLLNYTGLTLVILGCLITAVCAGVLYGLNFVPVIYMIDNPDRYPNYPKDGLAYLIFNNFKFTSTHIGLHKVTAPIRAALKKYKIDHIMTGYWRSIKFPLKEDKRRGVSSFSQNAVSNVSVKI